MRNVRETITIIWEINKKKEIRVKNKRDNVGNEWMMRPLI